MKKSKVFNFLLMRIFVFFVFCFTCIFSFFAWSQDVDTGELYSFLKKAAAPYSGQKISVYITEGVPANMAMLELVDKFEQVTSIDVEFIRVPYPNSYEKVNAVYGRPANVAGCSSARSRQRKIQNLFGNGVL